MTKKWIELELLADSDARLPVVEGGRITVAEASIRTITGYSDQMLGTGASSSWTPLRRTVEAA